VEQGHRLAAVVDPFVTATPVTATAAAAATTVTARAAVNIVPSLDAFFKGGAARDIDVAIEFTRPDTAPENIAFLVKRRIPVVVGTTGWYEKLPEITAAVTEAGAALLYAPNFSLGVNLFYRIAAFAARLADAFPEYDVGGVETHHNKKADSPSGTARALAEQVLANMTRKTTAVYDKLDRPPEADELHFASLRVGSAPGIHSLIFDSPADTIEITHTARGRDGLVSGAIAAAEWLTAAPKSGVFTMEDVLNR
jgi:4-hydroxy-tetrahydrodipicolinate reductase